MHRQATMMMEEKRRVQGEDGYMWGIVSQLYLHVVVCKSIQQLYVTTTQPPASKPEI